MASGGGLAFCCTMLLYATMLLAIIVSSLGLLIYNGLYWGQINHIFNVVPNGSYVYSLWQLALATWILALIGPAIGPIIPCIIFLAKTTQVKCDIGKNEIVTAFYGNTSFTRKWTDYLKKNHQDPAAEWEQSEWYREWFKKRCLHPRVMNFGFLILFIYTLICAISVKVFTKIKSRKNNDQYQKQGD